MSKHRFRDSGWTAGPRLGSCDGEERLQSVETSYTQQSPLRIQRSANSQSHMCNQSNADKAHIPLSLSYFCTLGSSWHLVVSIFVICFFGMFFFFFPRLNLLYVLLAVLGSYNDVTPRQFFNVQVQTFQM